MKCEVRGFNFFLNDDGRKKFTTLATGEVFYPELDLVIKGVRLVYYPGKGYTASPPIAHLRDGGWAMSWYHGSPLAKAAMGVMMDAYRRLGGKMPDGEKPQPAVAQDMPVTEMGLSIDDGLARTLGVAA